MNTLEEVANMCVELGGETPEQTEFVADASEVMFKVIKAAVITTCTVYLRPECIKCQIALRTLDFPDFLNEYGKLMFVDVNQFMRQLVIWAKDQTEEHMNKPCTMDDMS